MNCFRHKLLRNFIDFVDDTYLFYPVVLRLWLALQRRLSSLLPSLSPPFLISYAPRGLQPSRHGCGDHGSPRSASDFWRLLVPSLFFLSRVFACAEAGVKRRVLSLVPLADGEKALAQRIGDVVVTGRFLPPCFCWLVPTAIAIFLLSPEVSHLWNMADLWLYHPAPAGLG